MLPNKEKYKSYLGKTVELISMDDIQAPPQGTRGKVVYVDDAGQIHVKWENGSSLALIPGVDKFKVVQDIRITKKGLDYLRI